MRYSAQPRYPFPAWPYVIVDFQSLDERYPYARDSKNGRWYLFKTYKQAQKVTDRLNKGYTKPYPEM